jgi:nitric oxide reductase subunit C
MLSKSQAKTFFLVGTFLCGGAFIGLTVDTLRQIPKLTHAENMTESVIRGKHLFDRNNCMGCHTILGEGAYYAPELTKVYERRGEAFIKAMLTDPEAMYPGNRKMVTYKFTDEQKQDMVNFLKWIGEMNLQGFPPRPTIGQVAAPNATEQTPPGQAVVARRDRPQIFNQMCVACHSLEGQGGAIGPALDGVGSRRDADYIKRWLTNPLAIKENSRMPKLPLSESDITELTAFLSQLKEKQQ